MSFVEYLTIYLAIGAPFGVYFFLKGRANSINVATLLLKSVGAALCWIFVAGRFFYSQILLERFALSASSHNFGLDNKLEVASQNLQNSFAALSYGDNAISFFEFRELLERYIGLTLALQSSSLNSTTAEHELEVFRVVNRQKSDLQLAGAVYHRRNYLRLQTHQLRASQSFLEVSRFLKEKLLAQSSGELAAWQQYQTQAVQLGEILEDKATVRNLKKLFLVAASDHLQISETNDQREQELWKNLQSSVSVKTLSPKVLAPVKISQPQD